MTDLIKKELDSKLVPLIQQSKEIKNKINELKSLKNNLFISIIKKSEKYTFLVQSKQNEYSATSLLQLSTNKVKDIIDSLKSLEEISEFSCGFYNLKPLRKQNISGQEAIRIFTTELVPESFFK